MAWIHGLLLYDISRDLEVNPAVLKPCSLSTYRSNFNPAQKIQPPITALNTRPKQPTAPHREEHTHWRAMETCTLHSNFSPQRFKKSSWNPIIIARGTKHPNPNPSNLLLWKKTNWSASHFWWYLDIKLTNVFFFLDTTSFNLTSSIPQLSTASSPHFATFGLAPGSASVPWVAATAPAPSRRAARNSWTPTQHGPGMQTRVANVHIMHTHIIHIYIYMSYIYIHIYICGG